MAATTCDFDQWQKDEFFSAAEAVQESADTMESVYRMWSRNRVEEAGSETSDDLRRELQIALGTAKWQLEEFERAVKTTHGKCSSEDSRIRRHGHFVSAIQSQISLVKKSLEDSLVQEGKQPLRWVQLDDEERDDLAMFLSTCPWRTRDKTQKCADIDAGRVPVVRDDCAMGFRETVTISSNSNYVVELEAKELSETRDKGCDQGERNSRASRSWSSADIGSWKIVIADKDDAEKKMFETRTLPLTNFYSLMKNVGKTARSKCPKISFRKEKSGGHLHPKGETSGYLDLKRVVRFAKGRNDSNERHISCNEDHEVYGDQQMCARSGGFKRQYQIQFTSSLKVTLLLMLALFLIVPFVFYSN